VIHSIVHLVDDASAGGVNRTIDFLANLPALQDIAVQTVVRVERGQLSAPAVDADLIVSHLSVCWANLPLLTALRADNPTTPMVHWEHSYCERFVAQHVTNRDRFHALLRSAYALFDRVGAVSETQRAWLARVGACSPEALVRIEPCVDLAPFAALPDPAGRTPRVVGAIGRLAEQKGFDILVRAFQSPRLDHLTLHVYGDGPDRSALEVLAQGSRNVVFEGFAADPAAAMAKCDLVAMPSRWEPYGLVAIEAMAAGRPLLTTRCDGLADHIRNGAIDVGQNTPGAWVDALVELSQDDEREVFRCVVDAEHFAASWQTLLTSLLAHHAVPAKRAPATFALSGSGW
jgi:glycosyltransferase involved in cell wall biosynthesis